jgi:peptide/nickel transport system substrate-binding protein
MNNFLSYTKKFNTSNKPVLGNAIASFSKTQFTVFIISLAVATFAVLFMLIQINNTFIVEVPSEGGTITEGIIGAPTLINPVLALSDADKDLTAIVYSGLMRKGENGILIPDLADAYDVSANGLIYTFSIKKSATFQDGTPVTASDVLFTINKIQDPLIKSPRKTGWDGIVVTKKDNMTIVFTLSKPYISFMNNTTIGILPEHVWKNVTTAEFGLSILNIKAIGSGPYKIVSVSKNSDGIPQKYQLTRSPLFSLGEPHVKNFTIVSYANEKELINALVSHNIDQAGGVSAENAKLLTDNGYRISASTLPRIFGMFWNSVNNKVLADHTVISALDMALDRQAIIDQVLAGYGTIIHTPIPSTILPESGIYTNGTIDQANLLLDKAGWTMGTDGIRSRGGMTTVIQKITNKKTKKVTTKSLTVPSKQPSTRLEFSLTTGDTPELKQSSQLIKQQLARIGVLVDVKIYETGPLNQLIRTRRYEALFFGQVINNESDLFAFWHSSQKADPGLNVAMYSNPSVDTLLLSAQKTLSPDVRMNKYKDFITAFNKDTPALLIYSPKYLYATSKDLDHILIGNVSVPSDRFSLIYTWYASKDRVWKIFTKK